MKITTCFLCFFLAASFALITSCSSDKEEELTPDPQPAPAQCVTASVTYTNTVVGLLTANCTNCHSANLPSGGIALDTYAGVKAQVTTSRLMGAINHTAGFSPMPKNGAKLSACDIAKIKKWVDDGAPNN